MNFGLGVKSQQQIHDWRRKMKEDEEKTRGGVREAWISSPFYVLLPWKQVTKWVSSLSSVKSFILGNKRKGIELMLPCISCNSHWQKRNWQDKWRKQESKKRPLGLKCDLQPPAHDSFSFLLFFPLFSSWLVSNCSFQVSISYSSLTCLSLFKGFSRKRTGISPHLSSLLWVNLLMCHPLAFSSEVRDDASP